MAIHTLLIHRLAMSTAMVSIYQHLLMHEQLCYRHMYASAVHIMVDYSQRGVYRYLTEDICANGWMDFQEGEICRYCQEGEIAEELT